ncbi:MAG: hypothetical protein ACF8OB_00720 [Phycisphaeraceae bacterium JB051]
MSKAMVIASIEDRMVTLAPRPGNRSYVTERQKSQVAELLSKILGMPVSLQIQEKQAQHEEQASQGGGMSQRQAAMTLPLVEQINELFDVSLVEVAEDQSALIPPPDMQTEDDDMSEDDQEDDDV